MCRLRYNPSVLRCVNSGPGMVRETAIGNYYVPNLSPLAVITVPIAPRTYGFADCSYYANERSLLLSRAKRQ